MAAQRFADAVRTLAAEARAAGLLVPSFRSPPGVPGAARTVRRRPDGTVQVSVAILERPWPAVESDLVEGIVVANRLAGPAADGLRRALWAALHSGLSRDVRHDIGEPSGVAGKDDDEGRAGPLARRRTPPAASVAGDDRRCVPSQPTTRPAAGTTGAAA